MSIRSLLAAALAAVPWLAASAAAPPAAAAPAAPPAATAPASEAKAEQPWAHFSVPLFDERFESLPVAEVDGDAIELRELTGSLATAHEGRGAAGTPAKKDFNALLQRLVSARLLVREARDAGMGELPEISAAMKAFRDAAIVEALQEHATKGAQADPADVQRRLEEMVREWKMKSVLFPKEEDATRAGALVAGGAAFDEVVKRAVAEKRATGGDDPQFVPEARLLPAVATAVSRLEPGAVSAPIGVPGGFALVRLDGKRVAESPRARAEAEAQALSAAKRAALEKYYAGVLKRWVKIDEALLKSLDYEAPRPGFEALKKDRRALVRIQGEKAITVGVFSEALEKEFFHGVKEALRTRRVNAQKAGLVDGLVSKVVVPKEARRLALDRTPEFRRKLADYERSLLFGVYVEKAIVPNVKVEEDELRAYYDRHKADYAYPAFYRLEAIGFADPRLARAAVEKLRAGTDFKWMKANGDGQLKEGDRRIVLEGSLVSVRSLPAELARALSGAAKGDYRLHADGDQHYVVHVVDEVAASEQPFAEVRESIAQKLQAERVARAIEDTAEKLRAAYEVKVFITRIGS